MLKKIRNNKLRILLSVPIVLLLIAVRFLEKELFYDPFLIYFHQNFTLLPLPKTDSLLLFKHLAFRYFLNAVLSLALLYIVFMDKKIIAFTAVLYVTFFILLLVAFYIVLYYFGENQKMTLFYIRRFLIQPLFVLLFIPAIYFQKLT